MFRIDDFFALANEAADGSAANPALIWTVRLAAFGLLAVAAVVVISLWFAIKALSGRRADNSIVRRAHQTPSSQDIQCLETRLAELARVNDRRSNYINSVFATISDGLLLVDPNGEISLFTPRAAELIGLDQSIFFVGAKKLSESNATLSAALELAKKSKLEGRAEARGVEGSGKRTLDLNAIRISDKYDGFRDYGSLVIVSDVTELRRLEGVKKDFVANVSHEFRTPLTLISGFIEMLRSGNEISSKDRIRALEIIEIETERLKRLVSELLSLSEIEHRLPLRRTEAFDCRPLIERLAELIRPLCSAKNQSLELEIDRVLPSVAADGHWLDVALRNLIENAVKYGRDRGRIVVGARAEETSVAIYVRDDGPGIAEEEHVKIFERFYRVEKSRGSASGGSGLGLALVKDIAELLDGRVELESSLGTGSTFTLYIPRT